METTHFIIGICLGLVLSCQAQDCSRPNPGANMVLRDSDIVLNTFPSGSQATFVCGLGYTRESGSGVVTCNAGNWSAVMLKCKRKSCGSPGQVENGDIEYPTGIDFGDKIVIKCNPGYNLVGKSELTCGDQGWMDRLPECERMTCEDPPSQIPGGTFSPVRDTYYYLDAVRYTCTKDLTLTGSSTLTCSEDGTFKPDPPQCVEVECAEPQVANAEQVAGSRPPHKYQATMTFSCNAGYEMEGEATLVCGVSGQWTPGIPKCRAVTCNPPPSIANGAFSPQKESYQYSEVVVYSCHPGFTLSGSKSLTCSLDGTFKGAPPTCREVECAEPQVANAEQVAGSRPPHKYQATMTFRCNAGYEMEGEATLVCGVSGQWTPGIPKCRALTCSPPLSIANGAFSPQKESYQYSEVVEYSCHPGFTLSGSKSLSCSLDGTFKGAPPTCRDDRISPISIVVGCVVAIIFVLIAVVIYLVCRKKRGRRGYKREAIPEEVPFE